MSCFSPLQAFQLGNGEIVFAERGNILRPLDLPCGQCIGCRLERSRQWAVRCLHESQLWDFSSFITLTYDDDHMPVDHSLHYRDFQLFMKRVRKYFSHVDDFGNCWRQRIRFFMCGEYGERTNRPHYHACLFGPFFSDRVSFKRLDSGFQLYTSKILSSLWTAGFSSVGDVSFESAAYVARYIMKKRFGDVANECSYYRFVDDYGEVHYREPEFAHMSLKPGIGAKWFDKYGSDVFPLDHVIVGGLECKPPKYYDRLATSKYAMSVDWDSIEFDRYKKSLIGVEDRTPERLAVREKVASARLRFKVRTLE